MIDLVNVQKSFGDNEVLKNINIHINDKEIYGIIGQSGAGNAAALHQWPGGFPVRYDHSRWSED